MKLCVLGSNSFSGQDFISRALDEPETEILAVSRSAEKSNCFLGYKSHHGRNRVRFSQYDMRTDARLLVEYLDWERPDAIVNFAAQSEVAPSWEHPEHWFETNTVALAKLVKHLSKVDYLRRYVHISSPEAYGNCVGAVTEQTPDYPSTPYAASKAAADMLLSTFHRQYDFPLVTVRSTNVYGPRQQLFKIIPRSIINIKLGKKIPLHGGGVAVKSYIHIGDVSEGEWRVLNHGRIGERYHLAPDQGVSVREIVRQIATLMGTSLEKVSETVGERPGQDAAYVIDATKAREELGWKPTRTIITGLAETIEWVEANWSEIRSLPLEYRHAA